jgi:hypothetical protein
MDVRTLCAGVLVAGLLGATPAYAQGPSIEGTYRLISRTFKDGRVLKPPQVMGLQTYTKGYRQFNIVSKGGDGKTTSRSILATYTLTPNEYTETPIFHLFVRGEDIRNLSDQPVRSAVTVENGRITFKTEQRTAVYEGRTFTATSPESVDLWEKVD